MARKVLRFVRGLNLWQFALFRAGLVTLLAMLMPLISAGLDRLTSNPLTSAVEELRDLNLDFQVQVLHTLRWDHSLSNIDLAPVYYIGFDKAYLDIIFAQPVPSTRAALLEVLEKVDEISPTAVFADVDMTYPGGEAGTTQIDRDLLSWLVPDEPRAYPVLLPSIKVAGTPIVPSPSVCPVSGEVFWDEDGLVRHTSLRSRGDDDTWHYGASYVLQLLAQRNQNRAEGFRWQDCQGLNEQLARLYEDVPDREEALRGGPNQRILFRGWTWGGPNPSPQTDGEAAGESKGSFGASLWEGARYYSAEYFLSRDFDLTAARHKGAIILIGVSEFEAAQGDQFITPIDYMSGADIHFHALMTLLHYHRPGQLGVYGFRWLFVPLLYAALFVVLFVAYWIAQLVSRPIPLQIGNLVEVLIIYALALPLAVYSLHSQHLFLDYATPAIVIQFVDLLFDRKPAQAPSPSLQSKAEAQGGNT